ncbi:MAG: ABC transporter permease [Coriobacteriales bacterium]|jgi:putative ABC transport system permease protein|nr:ABC transporter permease [Coriobacteriales bacterium]
MLVTKQIRALKHNVRSVGICVLMVGIGVAVLTGLIQAGVFISCSFNKLLEETNYCDITVKADALTDEDIKRCSNLFGVDLLEAELSFQSSIKTNNGIAPLVLRASKNTTLNKPAIVDGLPISNVNDIVLNIGFAKFHGFNLGDKITIDIEKKKYTFTIVGLFTSPDLLYYSRPTELSGRIGYAEINILSLGVSDIKKNTLRVTVQDESVSVAEMSDAIANVLNANEGIKILTQSEADGIEQVQRTLNSLNTLGIGIACVIFLIASVLSMLTISRMIENEAKSIAVLKALGYSRAAICRSYMLIGICVYILGIVIGIALGAGISVIIFAQFRLSLLLPDIDLQIDTITFAVPALIVLCLGLCISVISIFSMSKKEVRLLLNIGIRNASAATWLQKRINTGSPTINYALRSALNNKKRAATVVLLSALCCALTITLLNINNNNDVYIKKIMPDTYLHDIQLTLEKGMSQSEIEDELKVFNGILNLEGLGEMAVEIPSAITQPEKIQPQIAQNECTEEVTLCVLPDKSELYGIYKNDSRMSLPSDGVVMSTRLLQRINKNVGDSIVVLEADSGCKIETWISDSCTPFAGNGVFMSESAFVQATGKEPTYSKVMVSLSEDTLRKEWVEQVVLMQYIIDAVDMQAASDGYRESNQSTAQFLFMLASLGIAIAALLFISVMITVLAERTYEFLMLKSMGYFSLQISLMVLIEFFALLVLGLIMALPISHLLINVLISVSSNDPVLVPYVGISAPAIAISYFGAITALLIGFVVLIALLKRQKSTYSSFFSD